MEAIPVTNLARPTRWQQVRTRLRRLFAWRNWVFHVTVLIPTTLAIVYYGLIASDVYLSESRFVVRSPEKQAGGLSFDSILSGAGLSSHSEDDAFTVRDYILSRDALRELDEKIGIRRAYTSQHIDFVDRFHGVDWDDSFEALFLYYTRHIVSIDIDSSSSISTLVVHAYTADDARNINGQLLVMAERLVNQLNERSRGDLISVAEKEVQIGEDRTTSATLALSAFRNRQSLFEPDRQSMIQLEGVARLEEELVTVEAQLSQIEHVSPSNPQIASLQHEADTLRRAIAEETNKVAGGRGSLSSKSISFERLVLEKEFAEKQLASAIAALESARNQARRQQLYLERLVQPDLPDKAMEPRRIRSIVIVFALGMILWGVLSLILASVREHID